MKSKRKLLDVVRILCNNKIAGLPISKLSQEGPMNGFSGFSDVFMISALEGDGLNSIKVDKIYQNITELYKRNIIYDLHVAGISFEKC